MLYKFQMKKEIVLCIIISILMIIAYVMVGYIMFASRNNSNTIVVAQNDVNELIENKENIEELPNEEPTTEPSEQPTVEPSPEVEKTEFIPSKDKYYIKVNTQMNAVTIYTKDEEGNYTIPIKAMICSTGDNTPKNTSYILNGKKWLWQPLFGNVYGQYTTHIDSDILFHSVPYVKPQNNTLEYWEYDKLGTTCSLGCVRLKVEDAKWIYDYCIAGTIVEFYADADPGPLGKPTAEKISDYEEYRDWDPTDPDENNPWKNL